MGAYLSAIDALGLTLELLDPSQPDPVPEPIERVEPQWRAMVAALVRTFGGWHPLV